MNFATWTPERVETLRTLHADGLSASDIAAQLGGVSRNAVIGKKSRLGLVSNQPVAIRTSPVKRVRKPKVSVMSYAPVWQKPSPMLCEPVAIEDDIPSDPVTFAELRNDQCKFPYGDRDYTFCGKKQVYGPYCRLHAARCFNPR